MLAARWCRVKHVVSALDRTLAPPRPLGIKCIPGASFRFNSFTTGRTDDNVTINTSDIDSSSATEGETKLTDVARARMLALRRQRLGVYSPVVGDPNRVHLLNRMLRVDHAGEVGATRIYEGQLAVLGKSDVGPVLREMKEQEKVHLDTFNQLLPQYRVRPTFFLPVWEVAGYVLGASTAMLGKEAAMACTVAVEEVIGGHYNAQLRDLHDHQLQDETEIRRYLKQFRDEELEHLQTGIDHNAEQAPLYQALTTVIKTGCHGAIWVAERL